MPLFLKFSIAIIFIVMVFGTINSILIYNNVQSALQGETEKRAMFIANNIAHQVVQSILFEDYVTLQNIINGIKEIDKNIEYMFVVDNSGKVVVHTFPLNFPEPLISANSLDDSQEFSTQLIKLKDQNEELVLDVAVPILNGRIGIVRVGLKESSILEDVQKTVNVFWIMVGVFLLFGITGAFVFANFITKPIKTIQNVADKIELAQIGKQPVPQIKIRDKFLGRIKILFRAEDEIDILADRFNQMIIRLDKAYRELQHAQAKLIQSEKLATVGTLTAGLAHEINNPVAGLQNCIRRIKNDPMNIEQNLKYFVMMENALEKISKVVGNLLNFTRKQSGDFVNLSINEIVENSLLLISHRIEKLGIFVIKNIPKDLANIKGNKNQLEQVLLNLFINSIDSIEEKLNLNPNVEKRLIISAKQKDNFLKIVVEDTGNGISDDIKGKIFDPFFTTKPPGKGTGLGLSIVYNIIEAHQGKISIDSEKGKGTIVNLYLPLFERN